MKKIYITTAIDYTNDIVHLGHSYQKVVADTLARYYRLKLGKENVYFVTGTDEHGGNIERIAKENGKKPKIYVDEIVEENKKQWKSLNISFDRFIRTTDEDHIKTVIDFWSQCQKDLEERTFKGLYCYGCEAYKTENEIVEGKCLLHPTKSLEEIEEKNWFFKWSKYQSFLEKLFDNNRDFVVPPQRWQEMTSFLALHLNDIPVSRPQEKISWGIPVPGDPSQTIYVWFDALISYYTAAKEKGFWAPPRGLGPARRDKETEIIHILGKDNTRWHALLWPAMLESAKLRLPDTIYSHGFVNLDGQKISKSLGNVIRPTELVDQYGADAVRYYLLRYGPTYEDVDLSLTKLKTVYNADLANGLGNLVSRVIALVQSNCDGVVPAIDKDPDSHPLRVNQQIHNWKKSWADIDKFVPVFEFNQALKSISDFISAADKYINETEPWHLVKENRQEFNWVIYGLLDSLHQISWQLYPFMPQTAINIATRLNIKKLLDENPNYNDSWTNIKPGEKITGSEPLFPRL